MWFTDPFPRSSSPKDFCRQGMPENLLGILSNHSARGVVKSAERPFSSLFQGPFSGTMQHVDSTLIFRPEKPLGFIGLFEM